MPPVQCNGCHQSFLGSHTLSVHRDGDTHGSSTFPCLHPSCGSSFCSRRSLLKHGETESHLEPQLNCNNCTQKFWSSAELAKHVRDVHGAFLRNSSDKMQYRRESFGRFSTSPSVVQHVREQHPPTQSPTSSTSSHFSSTTSNSSLSPSIVCGACQQTFWSTTALASHRGGEVDPNTRFSCNFSGCHYVACSAATLQKHKETRRHSDLPVNPARSPLKSTGTQNTASIYVRCVECSQRIKLEDVTSHMDRNHPSFQCTDCEEQFQSAESLSEHQASGVSLEEEIIVTCPCGAKFSGHAAAHQHLRDNERHPNHLFCFECCLSFQKLSDYVCHNDRKHPDINPSSHLAKTTISPLPNSSLGVRSKVSLAPAPLRRPQKDPEPSKTIDAPAITYF